MLSSSSRLPQWSQCLSPTSPHTHSHQKSCISSLVYSPYSPWSRLYFKSCRLSNGSRRRKTMRGSLEMSSYSCLLKFCYWCLALIHLSAIPCQSRPSTSTEMKFNFSLTIYYLPTCFYDACIFSSFSFISRCFTAVDPTGFQDCTLSNLEHTMHSSSSSTKNRKLLLLSSLCSIISFYP